MERDVFAGKFRHTEASLHVQRRRSGTGVRKRERRPFPSTPPENIRKNSEGTPLFCEKEITDILYLKLLQYPAFTMSTP